MLPQEFEAKRIHSFLDPQNESSNYEKVAYSYDDVLLVPRFSEINSRSEVDTSTLIAPGFKLEIPLISINMDSVTGVEMAVSLGKSGGLGLIPRFDSPEVQAKKVYEVKSKGVRVGAAVGCKRGYIDRVSALVKAGADLLTVDVAHGHMKQALEATSMIKNLFGDIPLVSGVIATYEGARDLFAAGADSVRVGVGPGTICTTRIKTGCGVPQITAVIEAAKAAREFKKTVLCDGGTKNSGDVVKGLAAGASAVIIGSQFAGCDEAPGRLVQVSQSKISKISLLGVPVLTITKKPKARIYKVYNASTSKTEKLNHIQKFSEDKESNYSSYIEGVEALVPLKGPVADVVEEIMSGLRSGMSYTGSKTIEELWQNARFIPITPSGLSESNHHSVTTS